MNHPDEFYIGWEAKSPSGIQRSTRKIVVCLLVLALILPLALAVSQRLIGVSFFEWGTKKSFSGILQARPYPHLLIPRPTATGRPTNASAYYLVSQGKFGLPADAVGPLDGKPVTLKGTLIYRDNQTMIETRPEWIEAAANGLPVNILPVSELLGRRTLVGEIVDSKCFLGVMNPGQLAPHRACAIRCISGGVPPMFIVKLKSGPPLHFLLVSPEGKPVNREVLDFVAEPVEITGDVERQGELLILRADPATFKRL